MTNEEERWESVFKNERMRFSQTSLQEKCPFILTWQVYSAAHSTLHWEKQNMFTADDVYNQSQVFLGYYQIHFSGTFWVQRIKHGLLLGFALEEAKHFHRWQSPDVSRWFTGREMQVIKFLQPESGMKMHLRDFLPFSSCSFRCFGIKSLKKSYVLKLEGQECRQSHKTGGGGDPESWTIRQHPPAISYKTATVLLFPKKYWTIILKVKTQ